MEAIIQEKFLYFQEAKSGGGSTVGADDVAMYPLSLFLGFDTQAADTNGTTLNMRFKPMKRSSLVTDEGGVGEETDVVVLTVTANKQKSVMQAIIDKINEPLAKDGGFIIIADVPNSDFIHSDISSCTVTLRAATA
mgnify:FL=1